MAGVIVIGLIVVPVGALSSKDNSGNSRIHIKVG